MTAENELPHRHIPIGSSGLSGDECIALIDTPERLGVAYRVAKSWVNEIKLRYSGEMARVSLEHWEYRIGLLKAKALLMGISLED